MYFNFNLFSALAARAYKKLDSHPYSLEDVLRVFEYYFQKYEATFNEVHPPIRMEQIERIISAMPYIDCAVGSISDIDADGYEALIDKHFETKYRNCNYRVNHFFSGDIRLMRYYEELY